MDIPLLKNGRTEDIEDVTERYIPMFTEERNSDTVKRIKILGKDTLFFCCSYCKMYPVLLN